MQFHFSQVLEMDHQTCILTLCHLGVALDQPHPGQGQQVDQTLDTSRTLLRGSSATRAQGRITKMFRNFVVSGLLFPHANGLVVRRPGRLENFSFAINHF